MSILEGLLQQFISTYNSDKVSNSNNINNSNSNEMNNSNNNSNNNSDKLDSIILIMNDIKDALLIITKTIDKTNNSDKVSNSNNINNSTDTESDTESDSDIEKEYILNNISNNILEKNLLEKVSERMKDKNSDKECSVETPHSNESNIVESTPSKSFPFSSSEDEANSIDINNNDTPTEMPLSSAVLKDKTKDEQHINPAEKVLENALKQEVPPMKENEDKRVKEYSVCTPHSNVVEYTPLNRFLLVL